MADSGDDWTLTEDDDHSSVTEYEIIEDDTVEESQDSESSSTCAEILVSFARKTKSLNEN